MHEDINELQLHFKSPIFPTEIIISKHLKKKKGFEKESEQNQQYFGKSKN